VEGAGPPVGSAEETRGMESTGVNDDSRADCSYEGLK
jgi:hypothetical protein